MVDTIFCNGGQIATPVIDADFGLPKGVEPFTTNRTLSTVIIRDFLLKFF